MIETTLEEGVGIAFDALQADRLALLCGAGLSMAAPSNLPSAASLAAEAKRRYDTMHGLSRQPLPAEIGEQAEFFFQRGELGSVYLRSLIDPHVFAAPPNPGHVAVADFLLTGAVQIAVSTNVDMMIETAGQMLFGQIGVGIERTAVAALPADASPLLKVHGCWTIDRPNTVWARGQLSVDPVANRIAGSEEWMSVKLLDRDLVIVGFSTDWDYLNGVLERTLGEVAPARVVVVNPDDSGQLVAKAPELFALGQRAKVNFFHVKSVGDAFLDSLRRCFSKSFVRRTILAGGQAYTELSGSPPDPDWAETSIADNDALWRVRRDLEGCTPNQPSRQRRPPEEPALGLTILQLRAKGAVEDGPYWAIGGQRVRLLRTPNQMLHHVQAAFARETPPVVAADITAAVGAEVVPLPSHVVRGNSAPSIARGAAGRWLTRQDLVTELAL